MNNIAVGKEIRFPNGKKAPFSQAFRANGFLFVSGQLPFNEQGDICNGGIEEQTMCCLKHIDSILVSEGLSKESISKVTIWLTNVDDFQGFNIAYENYFQGHKPSRSSVRSDLMIPGALVEIEVVAFY